MLRFKFYAFITFDVSGDLLYRLRGKTRKVLLPRQLSRPNKFRQRQLRQTNFSGSAQILANCAKRFRRSARVRDAENRNYEVEWKFSEFNCFLGRQTTDEKEADTALADGEKAGKIASRLAAEKPEGYFWYGANLGEEAKKSPVTVGIQAVSDIREAMNKVIEIQPDYQGASAYDVLAQIELSTGLLGGDAKKAVEYLEKAMTLEKNNTYLYLHLAQAYLAVGRKADAKKQLEALLQIKPELEYSVEYKETSETAKKLLATRF